MSDSQRISYILPAAILVAAILVGIVLAFGDRGGVPVLDSQSLLASISEVMAGANQAGLVLGDPKAPVTIVEVSDYQCPFCAKYDQEAGRQLRAEYVETGKAKIMFVDLAFLGSESVKAAEATYAAAEQGKYWEYHDYLFEKQAGENQGAFSAENLKKFAGELGLDVEKFSEVLDSGKYNSLVLGNKKVAEKLLGGQLSTPSIIIGDQLIQGAQPYEVFKEIIEGQLRVL